MKIRLCFAIFGAAALHAADPASSLYRQALKMAEHGKYERARAHFARVVSGYPYSPFAAQARDAMDAADLLEEAHQHVKAGRPGTARVALQTLISVYPETPLAEQARHEIRKADENVPIVRAIRFDGFEPIPSSEILDRFREREIGLAVESAYDSRSADEAKALLTGMLAARGVPRRAEVEVRPAKQRHVEITFYAVAK